MIKEICKYIDGNIDSLTLGKSLFEISADTGRADECIVVVESAPGLVNGLLVDYRQIPLTVYSRALTRFTARDNAYTVFDLLQSAIGKIQVTLGPIGAGLTYICNFECRTPYYTGLDDTGKRYVFSMPVDVTVTNMS